MKRLFLSAIFLLFAFPYLLTGEGKAPSLPAEKTVKNGEKKEGKEKSLPPSLLPQSGKKEAAKEKERASRAELPSAPPPKKKNPRELFFEAVPGAVDSLESSAPKAIGLWKKELEKDPHSFLKRVLETEKSGIKVCLPSTLSRKAERKKVSPHLLFCRECGKRFKTPPFFHAHKIRNDILLIKINKWDRATYTYIGRILNRTAKTSSLILWDLRDTRGDSPASIINTLAHLKKYDLPSALLVSGNTRGSGELFAKCLLKKDPALLSAGTKTAGLPFLMKKKSLSFPLENGKKKLLLTLLLPQIPPRFSQMDCSPFVPKILLDRPSFQGKGKDLILHHLCDLFLAKRILDRGKRK